MHLEIRHLELVVAITEEKTVTAAGKRLHLTQSALSHQLKEIESRLGTELFLRLNKKMVLTQAGEVLLQSARRILAAVRKTEKELSGIALQQKGKIRLSTECYTCYHWLPPLLKRFGDAHPGIEVEIAVEATQNPIPALLEGKLDLAVTSSDQLETSHVGYELLFEDEIVLAMHPGHRLAGRRFIEARDFAGEHLLTYGELGENSVYKRVIAPAGINPGKWSRVQLTEAILEMVKAGLGVAVMARWAVSSYLDGGQIKAVPLTRNGFTRRWYAATLKNESRPEYLTEFIKLISESGTPDKMGIAA